MLHDLLRIPSEDDLILDFHDLILGFKAGPVRRSIFNRTDDERPAVALSDIDAKTSVLPLHLDLFFLKLRGVDKPRIRVAPRRDHSVNGSVQQVVLFDRLRS